MATRSVAVVGAGLSGLTAAYRLTQEGWDVVVLESTAGPGGRVQTVRAGGYQVDIGASAFSGAYAPYISLVEELGLEYRQTSPYVGILRRGQVHLLNMDHMVASGLRTKLLGPAAKLSLARLGIDVFRAKRRGELDYSDMRKAAPLDTESARTYAERVMSSEIDQYICEPVVRTMLIADSDKVSKVELFSGIANIFASEIYAIQGGQGRVTEALAERLDVRLSSPVERITEQPAGVQVSYRDADGASHTEDFDACVVAVPLPVAHRICPDQTDLLSPLVSGLGYTQCLKVAIGTTVAPSSPAFLIQLPSGEEPDIALVFADHMKSADRAPAGHGLFDVCWETDASVRLMDAPDEQIIEQTLATLGRLYPDLGDTVDFAHITRWRRALPHTGIGAYRKIGEFNALLDQRARMQFAADFMSAAGQNTAVAFGNRAAERLDRVYGHSMHGATAG